MRTNKSDTNTACERAVRFPDLHAGIRESLEAALADERRHYAWILSRIDRPDDPGAGSRG
jgi:hypothetical protein